MKRHLFYTFLLVALCGVCFAVGRSVSTNSDQPPPESLSQPTITDTLPPDPSAVYLEAVGGRSASMGKAMANLGNLWQDPHPLNDNWRRAVALQVGSLQADYELVTRLEPPPDMVDIHEVVLTGAGACNDASEHITAALDGGGKPELDTAAALLQACADRMTEAKQMVDRYREGR